MDFQGLFLFFIVIILKLTRGQDVIDKTKPVLTFCVIMEEHTSGKVYDYRRAAAAIDLALDYAETEILRDYRLIKVFRPLEDQCSLKTYVIAQALDLAKQGVQCNVYIGPGCGMAVETLSDVAEYYDIPIIGLPAASLGMSAPAGSYPTTIRISFTYTGVAVACLRFFGSRNYTTPSFIIDQSINVFQQMGQLTEATFREQDFTLFTSTFFGDTFRGNRTTDNALDSLLHAISLQSRVTVIYSEAFSVRRIMLAAHRLGMTQGEHLFIAVDLYESPVWGTYTWQANDADDQAAKEAFKALLLLSLDNNGRSRTNLFWESLKKLSTERYGYTFGEFEEADLMLIHSFDAVYLYAVEALQRLTHNKNMKGVSFTNAIRNTSVYSPLSGNITFNKDCDKISDFALRSFSFVTGRHEVIYGLPGSGDDALIEFGRLDWFGRSELPPNNPPCGFDGNDLTCQNSGLSDGQLAAVIIIPFIAFVGLFLGGFRITQSLLFAEQDPFWWRIFLNEVEDTMTTYANSAKSVETSQLHSDNTRNFAKSVNNDRSSLLMDDKKEKKEVVVVNGILSSIYELPEPKQKFRKDLQGQLSQIRRLQNSNLQVLVGIIVDDTNHCVYLAGELCGRGNLKSLIADTKMELDWVFKNSLMKDMANGMSYLHSTKLVSHGFLTDECCLVDSRFVLKISGYGLGLLQNEEDRHPPNISQSERNWRLMLYRSPELLRRNMPESGTQKGDVYSYGILMQQIILRTDPFEMSSTASSGRSSRTQNIMEIVMEVKRGSTPPTRPTVRLNVCPPELHELMESCWSEEPISRPPFSRIRMQLLKILGRADDNIVDHLIHRMEAYAGELELEAEHKMKQFMEERQRSQELLSNILPKTIAQALLRGETINPQTYVSTTVYFGDIHGFAEAVESLSSPVEILGLLNHLYGMYDEILGKYDLYQVEAVSDAYLVVSGLPIPNGITHVGEIASMALEVRRAVNDMKTSSDKVPHFRLRVGINSGPCVAGVVGLQLPRYCLFGDTVNTASRMESHGEAGKIHCSESSKLLLDKFPLYITAERGEISIKGKGMMKTYWLLGKH